MKAGRIVKGICATVGVPLIAYFLLNILCQMNGKVLFGSAIDVRAFAKNTVATACLAWAISFNLMTGRFDFSLGAVSILSVIVGGNLAINMNLGPIPMLLFSVVVGGFLSLISGLVYIAFNLSPIIITLGITLIYESITFTINNAQGVNIIGKSIYTNLINPIYAFAICGVTLMILIVLFNFTKFGYDARALAHGQGVCVNSGIKEKRNAVLIFVISGMVAAITGCMNLAFNGKVDATLNLGTMSDILVLLPF